MLRWLCERQSRFKTEAFPLDRRRYYGCLYEPKGWSVLYTLEDIQQGLLLPRGLGREVCLFKIYALQQAGLHRILSPGFTGWTFSPCLPGAVGEWLMHVCYIVMCEPLSRTVSFTLLDPLTNTVVLPLLSADSCIRCFLVIPLSC